MPTHIGIGYSQDPDTQRAAQEAAYIAKQQTQQESIDLAIVFNTIHYNSNEALRTIQNILDDPQTIGCSTAGIILSSGIQMRGIAVLAISSDELKFGIGSVNDISSQDTRTAGNHLAKSALTTLGQYKRLGFLFFADGLLKDLSLMIKGVQEILGTILPIVGAGSSDDFQFRRTYQYYQDKAMYNGAGGLLIGGQLNLGIANRHGWKPLGRPRVVNKVDGHIIKMIDGKKACNIYEEYFGEEVQNNRRSKQRSRMAIMYPLGIYIEGETEYLLRNAIDILNDGSIVCQGEVPEGANAHIMIGNKDSCMQAAVEAATEAKESLQGKKPQIVLIFECFTRHKLLGRDAFQEIQMVKEILGKDIPMLGMYSYGEISPFHPSDHVKKTHLQNESIVILAIG